VDAEFRQEHGFLSELVEIMIQADPEMRPSAEELKSCKSFIDWGIQIEESLLSTNEDANN